MTTAAERIAAGLPSPAGGTSSNGHWGTGTEHNRPGAGPVGAATLGDLATRLHAGGSFILDAPAQPPAVWGEGDHVLWAQGEPTIITGPPGVGKSTIAGQLTRARLGLSDNLLGFPVVPTSSKILYLAMDRPQQIARNLARMFTEEERSVLNDRLIVWKGPPPADIGRNPQILTELAALAGADTLVIDSLKDAAVKLTDDEVGGNVNRAMQLAIENGVEVLVLHHQKKSHNDSKPKSLEALYGSVWIAAGCGSVLLLWGAAGDALVELSHLKQPAEDVGPLKIEHHHDGTSSVYRGFNLTRYLQNRPNGATVAEAGRARFEKDPTDAEKVKVKRELERMVKRGTATKKDAQLGGEGGSQGARYWLAHDIEEFIA